MGLYGDNDLVVTDGVTYTRTLRYLLSGTPINWSLYTVVCTARLRDGTLVFDLGPFLTVSGTDNTALLLEIDAQFTGALTNDSKWDLLGTLKTDSRQVFRTPQPPGRIIVLKGVSHGS